MRAANVAAVKKLATAKTATTTKTTAGRPLTLSDSSEDEDEDIVELAKRREQEEKKRRAKKRPAAVSNPYTTATNTAKLKASTASQQTSSNSKPFYWQVATYNVWFGPDQEGSPHPEERMSQLCRELLETSEPTSMSLTPQLPLLFCGFQEVVPALNEPIQRAMQASGYKVYSQPGAHYGCALAVKCRGPDAVTVLDAGWQGFTETVMARGFLHCRARLPDSEQQVLFTTTHLESWAGKDHTGMKQRAQQVQEMEVFCNQQFTKYPNLQSAIITGDLNWDDERRSPVDATMDTVLRTQWKDAWLETKSKPKDTCYTYDGKMNPMLGNSLRRRFDRILIRCRSSDNEPPLLVPTTTRLLGTQAIPGLTFQKFNPYTKTSKEYAVAPSDHFGFVAHLQTNNV
jgi:endonuclease/exonuclease/phosphatase family metal-dependent hydrolase